MDTPTSSNQPSLSQHTPTPPPSANQLQRVLTSANQCSVTCDKEPSESLKGYTGKQGDRVTVGLVTHVMGVKISQINIFSCLK